MERLTISIAEAADLSGLSRATLYRLIGEDRLETVVVGRRRLVRLASIKSLVGAT